MSCCANAQSGAKISPPLRRKNVRRKVVVFPPALYVSELSDLRRYYSLIHKQTFFNVSHMGVTKEARGIHPIILPDPSLEVVEVEVDAGGTGCFRKSRLTLRLNEANKPT